MTDAPDITENSNLPANPFDLTTTMKNGKQARAATRADRRDDDKEDDVGVDKEE